MEKITSKNTKRAYVTKTLNKLLYCSEATMFLL